MATCAVQPLLDDAACFAATTAGQLQWLQTVLLCRILQALDPMAECDVQGLLDDAACFAALPAGVLQLVQAQLLCNINTNIVNALPLCGSGDPNTNGTGNGTICGQTYVDTGTNTVYHWNGTDWA